jgi:hypothetical protein
VRKLEDDGGALALADLALVTVADRDRVAGRERPPGGGQGPDRRPYGRRDHV